MYPNQQQQTANGPMQPASSASASIVVTCKGRRHHVEQALPTMLSQQCHFEFELIVVDYGCPDGTFDWCRRLGERRLTALRVLDGTQYFSPSRARNCGAALAKSPILAFVDADIRLAPTWLREAAEPLVNGACGLSRVQRYRGEWDRGGTCAMQAALFHQVRGYDEAFDGWGAEDLDLYDRIAELAPLHWFSMRLLEPLRHNNHQRTRFHREKSIRASGQRNSQYVKRRVGPVNPLGYGTAQVEIARDGSVTRCNISAGREVSLAAVLS